MTSPSIVSTTMVLTGISTLPTMFTAWRSASAYNPVAIYPAGSVPPDWEGTILLHWEEGDHAGKAHEVWTVPQG